MKDYIEFFKKVCDGDLDIRNDRIYITPGGIINKEYLKKLVLYCDSNNLEINIICDHIEGKLLICIKEI